MDGYRILIADDDPNVHQALLPYFRREQYQVYSASNGEEALSCVRQYRPDMILLDIMMPRTDGLSVCREIRKTMNTPIIILSAKGEEFDKLLGLELGADDYITKPYATKELIARIRSALRRHEEPKFIADPSFTIGDLAIYPDRHEVRVGSEVIDLTKKEFDLLLFLAKNKNRVMKREDVLAKVWGYGYAGKTNIVDVYIRYLRSKIDEKVGKKYIHTVRGIGYVARD